MKKRLERIAKYLGSRGLYKEAAQIIKIAGVKIHNGRYIQFDGDGLGGKIFEFTNHNGQSFFYNVTTNVLADSLWAAEDPEVASEEASSGQIIVGSQRKELLKILVSQLQGQDYRDVSRRMEEEPASSFPVTRFQYGEREYENPDDTIGVWQPRFSTPSLTINGNILKYVESEMSEPGIPGISAINDYNSFTLDLQSGIYQSDEVDLDTALQILVADGRVTSGLGGRIARAVILNRKPNFKQRIIAAENRGDDDEARWAASMIVDGIPDYWLPGNGQDWKDDPVSAFYSFR